MNGLDITAGDLATVVGAGAAALVVTQFTKGIFNLDARWSRITAMVTGLAVVLITTLTTGGVDNVVHVLLAVIVGMQAGLSAAATFDVTRSGINYEVEEGT